jgi:hypothetical protein
VFALAAARLFLTEAKRRRGDSSRTRWASRRGRPKSEGDRGNFCFARTSPSVEAPPLRLAALGTSPERLRVQGRSWSSVPTRWSHLASADRHGETSFSRWTKLLLGGAKRRRGGGSRAQRARRSGRPKSEGDRGNFCFARTSPSVEAPPLRLAALATSPERLRVQGRSWSSVRTRWSHLASPDRHGENSITRRTKLLLGGAKRRRGGGSRAQRARRRGRPKSEGDRRALTAYPPTNRSTDRRRSSARLMCFGGLRSASATSSASASKSIGFDETARRISSDALLFS